MITKLPYPPIQPAYFIVPSAAAFIGVPFGAAISIPLCAWSRMLSIAPKRDVIFPVTGFTEKYTPLNVEDSISSYSACNFVCTLDATSTLPSSSFKSFV